MLPDKCPGNSIIPLWVAHLSWLRWRAEWGTDGASSLMLALTYELQAEPDEHTWLIIYWMLSRGSLESWAAPGINEGLDWNVKSRRAQYIPFICRAQTPSFIISAETLFPLTFVQHILKQPEMSLNLGIKMIFLYIHVYKKPWRWDSSEKLTHLHKRASLNVQNPNTSTHTGSAQLLTS